MYRPSHTIILIVRTPKKVPLILGNSHDADVCKQAASKHWLSRSLDAHSCARLLRLDEARTMPGVLDYPKIDCAMKDHMAPR